MDAKTTPRLRVTKYGGGGADTTLCTTIAMQRRGAITTRAMLHDVGQVPWPTTQRCMAARSAPCAHHTDGDTNARNTHTRATHTTTNHRAARGPPNYTGGRRAGGARMLWRWWQAHPARAPCHMRMTGATTTTS